MAAWLWTSLARTFRSLWCLGEGWPSPRLCLVWRGAIENGLRWCRSFWFLQFWFETKPDQDFTVVWFRFGSVRMFRPILPGFSEVLFGWEWFGLVWNRLNWFGLEWFGLERFLFFFINLYFARKYSHWDLKSLFQGSPGKECSINIKVSHLTFKKQNSHLKYNTRHKKL